MCYILRFIPMIAIILVSCPQLQPRLQQQLPVAPGGPGLNTADTTELKNSLNAPATLNPGNLKFTWHDGASAKIAEMQPDHGIQQIKVNLQTEHQSTWAVVVSADQDVIGENIFVESAPAIRNLVYDVEKQVSSKNVGFVFDLPYDETLQEGEIVGQHFTTLIARNKRYCEDTFDAYVKGEVAEINGIKPSKPDAKSDCAKLQNTSYNFDQKLKLHLVVINAKNQRTEKHRALKEAFYCKSLNSITNGLAKFGGQQVSGRWGKDDSTSRYGISNKTAGLIADIGLGVLGEFLTYRFASKGSYNCNQARYQTGDRYDQYFGKNDNSNGKN